MVCPTANILFDNYASAAMEFFEAADKLASLTGQHGQFTEGKKHAEQGREKCNAARSALEQHWAEHSCRGSVADGLERDMVRRNPDLPLSESI
jgi:hypothetical protein